MATASSADWRAAGLGTNTVLPRRPRSAAPTVGATLSVHPDASGLVSSASGRSDDLDSTVQKTRCRQNDEFVEAMKEDLAEWLNAIHVDIGLALAADDFFDQLETGVVLCRHANMVNAAAADCRRHRSTSSSSSADGTSVGYHVSASSGNLAAVVASDVEDSERDGETGTTSATQSISVTSSPKSTHNRSFCRPMTAPTTRQASAVNYSMTSSSDGVVQLNYMSGAQPGSFQARDNLSQFIWWCRTTLKVPDTLLFETEDLVSRKNERNVILCLLEVARRGSRLYGMLAPTIVRFEAEIDAELAGSECSSTMTVDSAYGSRGDLGGRTTSGGGSEETRGEADGEELRRLAIETICSVDGGTGNYDRKSSPIPAAAVPQPQPVLPKQRPRNTVAVDMMSLDEMVRLKLGACTCPDQYPMIKVAEGKYRIGDTLVHIFLRILRSHVMVRIGGGWDTLDSYLDRHDPCRCNSKQHRGTHAFLTSNGFDVIRSNTHADSSTTTTSQRGSEKPAAFNLIPSPPQDTSIVSPSSSTTSESFGETRSAGNLQQLQQQSDCTTSKQRPAVRQPKSKPQQQSSTVPNSSVRQNPTVPTTVTATLSIQELRSYHLAADNIVEPDKAPHTKPASAAAGIVNSSKLPLKSNLSRSQPSLLSVTASGSEGSRLRQPSTITPSSATTSLHSNSRPSTPSKLMQPSSRPSTPTKFAKLAVKESSAENQSSVSQRPSADKDDSSGRLSRSVNRSRAASGSREPSVERQSPRSTSGRRSSVEHRRSKSIGSEEIKRQLIGGGNSNRLNGATSNELGQSKKVVLSAGTSATSGREEVSKLEARSKSPANSKAFTARFGLTPVQLLPDYRPKTSPVTTVRSMSVDGFTADEGAVEKLVPDDCQTESSDTSKALDTSMDGRPRLRRILSLQEPGALMSVCDELDAPPEDPELNSRMEMLFEEYRKAEMGLFSSRSNQNGTGDVTAKQTENAKSRQGNGKTQRKTLPNRPASPTITKSVRSSSVGNLFSNSANGGDFSLYKSPKSGSGQFFGGSSSSLTSSDRPGTPTSRHASTANSAVRLPASRSVTDSEKSASLVASRTKQTTLTKDSQQARKLSATPNGKASAGKTSTVETVLRQDNSSGGGTSRNRSLVKPQASSALCSSGVSKLSRSVGDITSLRPQSGAATKSELCNADRNYDKKPEVKRPSETCVELGTSGDKAASEPSSSSGNSSSDGGGHLSSASRDSRPSSRSRIPVAVFGRSTTPRRTSSRRDSLPGAVVFLGTGGPSDSQARSGTLRLCRFDSGVDMGSTSPTATDCSAGMQEEVDFNRLKSSALQSNDCSLSFDATKYMCKATGSMDASTLTASSGLKGNLGLTTGSEQLEDEYY